MNCQPSPQATCFLLFDVLQAPAQLQPLAAFADADADRMQPVLEELVALLARCHRTTGSPAELTPG